MELKRVPTPPKIVDYNLTWGPNIVPEDTKDAFRGPLVHGRAFWSPWVWGEDGPLLEKIPLTRRSLERNVLWEHLEDDLNGLLEWGALGYVLVVDPGSRYLVVKIELLLEGIKVFALTTVQAKVAANVEINFRDLER